MSQLKILLVDDEQEFVSALAERLGLQGRLQWDDSDQGLTLTLPQALSNSE
jgi:hypothetical protein